MKGFLIFCALGSLIGLVWLLPPLLDDRDTEYESRLVGALNFVSAALDASQNLTVDFYSPAIKTAAAPNRWTLSGIIEIQDAFGDAQRKPFSAVLDSTCSAYRKPECWKIRAFTIADKSISVASDRVASPSPPAETMDAPNPLSSDVDRTQASVDNAAIQIPQIPGSVRSQSRAVQQTAPQAPLDTSAELVETNSASGIGIIGKLQGALATLGYDPGPVDGKLGPRTISAIQAYQQRHGLSQDGMPSRALLLHIEERLKNPDQ